MHGKRARVVPILKSGDIYLLSEQLSADFDFGDC